MICSDAEQWLTLQFLPGLGCNRILRLVEALGSARAVLENRKELRGACPGIGQALLALLNNEQALADARDKAQRELEHLVRQDISLLSYTCAEYPPALQDIADKPVLLYVKGQLSLLQAPMLAVVGARSASEYGRRTARHFAAMLAARDLVIVSGAAYGIDAAAHQGALQAHGKTVAVLGCGVDVAYPAAHRQLLNDIAVEGAVVSEFPMGAKPEAFRFPVRNRIISGLARAVLVVEASEKSGSLITARLALDQGREVLAIPGRIDSPKSSGTHWLIQQGAALVQRIDDIFEALVWSESAPLPTGKAAGANGPVLSQVARQVLQELDTYPADIDTLAQATGLAIADLQPLLLILELQGLVRQLQGQLYEKVS
ncbi:MAG: DNA-protecting protein DprA [Desulfobulbaceae bacterium]|nr:DNA-protecting protein DprA [Desulfobulbaceae bacterium]